MPLTLNNNQLWERIKKVEGKEFRLIETKKPFKILKVVDKGITTEENVETHKTYWLPRKDVICTYEHVKKYGKFTRADYDAEIDDPKRFRVPRLAQIIALLAFAVPEEIAPFTQDEGEHFFGVRLRGIRKKDC